MTTNLLAYYFVIINVTITNLMQMKNRTVRVIIILVGLLILNIEAAHAGITHKFKVLIANEFNGIQLFYVLGGVLMMGVLSYIILTPAFKESGKTIAEANFFQIYNRQNYQDKKIRVRKIRNILKNSDSLN